MGRGEVEDVQGKCLVRKSQRQSNINGNGIRKRCFATFHHRQISILFVLSHGYFFSQCLNFSIHHHNLPQRGIHRLVFSQKRC